MVQEIRFTLQLNLGESYIHGTAGITDGVSYSINIQQANDQSIILPRDFSNIEEFNQAAISFTRHAGDTIALISRLEIEQGDIIQVYINDDDVLLAVAKDPPIDMILQLKQEDKKNDATS
jgi:hypothetical protein